MSFPVERIPSEHELFKRVPRKKIVDDEPEPGVFVDSGPGVSTSWSKHSTAEECRDLCKSRPEAIGVFALSVEKIRGIQLEAQHTPRDWCRAHADIVGPKDPEVQVKLARIAKEGGLRVRPEPPKPSDSEIVRQGRPARRAEAEKKAPK